MPYWRKHQRITASSEKPASMRGSLCICVTNSYTGLRSLELRFEESGNEAVSDGGRGSVWVDEYRRAAGDVSPGGDVQPWRDRICICGFGPHCNWRSGAYE